MKITLIVENENGDVLYKSENATIEGAEYDLGRAERIIQKSNAVELDAPTEF